MEAVESIKGGLQATKLPLFFCVPDVVLDEVNEHLGCGVDTETAGHF